MVVAPARLAGAVGTVVPITAPVTLQVRHANFAPALPIVIAAGSEGTSGAAGAGQAALLAVVGVEAVGTVLAVQPRIARQTGAVSRSVVAPTAPHSTAVAWLS